jgi:hypothetical protein
VLTADYYYAAVLVLTLFYALWREPPRLLLTPLLLFSCLVIYGLGHFVYYTGAETVPPVHTTVVVSLCAMWAALIAGIECVNFLAPQELLLAARANKSSWSVTPISDRPVGNLPLAAIGAIVALYVFIVFIALGKPSQLLNFYLLDSANAKAVYRDQYGGQGGYLYQLLIASIAPFISFLLVVKGQTQRNGLLTLAGALVAAAVIAGKLGTFSKVPWLIYVLQLVAVKLLCNRLELGLGRLLLGLFLVAGGAGLAATIAIPGLDTVGIAEWLAFRFFTVNNEGIYQTLYVYPGHLPHTAGMNIGLLHSLFGDGQLVPAHTEVANFFGSFGSIFDVVFIGDAWVDFGLPGIVVQSFALGLLVKLIDTSILAAGKTPLSVALIGGCLYGVYQVEVTSLFTAMLSGGLLLIPLAAILSTALRNDLVSAVAGRRASPSGTR